MKENQQSNFGVILISWYQNSKRNLPWRNTSDPYKIWLSEVILQQTRVEQGMPYYQKFVKQYSTVKQLAKASEDEVLRLWQGLGYYSRARNLHATAKQVVLEHNGVFPKNYDTLIQLKGIGTYTGSAISSFCNNEVKAVVDGNVYRVLSRYFGVETDISSSQGKKDFQELANQLILPDNPGLFNQAIMEFGAMQCVPKNPDCAKCPFNSSCYALMKGKVSSLPVKLKRTKVISRYFNYLIFNAKGVTFLKKRAAVGIWAKLYEFPLIETEQLMDSNSVLKTKDFKLLIDNNKWKLKSESDIIKHQLSHQTLFCRFFLIDVYPDFELDSFEKTAWNKVNSLPKPIVIQKHLKTVIHFV